MSLYTKMLAIMEESPNLSKNMTVGKGTNKYQAISEKEVLGAIKPLLIKHKLIIFPVDTEFTEDDKTYIGSRGETTRLLTSVKVKWKIVDTESGETDFLASIGSGVDPQDKASGKAMTYAYKILLQKSFMLFSGEDADNQPSDEITEMMSKPMTFEEACKIKFPFGKKHKGESMGHVYKEDREYLEWATSQDDPDQLVLRAFTIIADEEKSRKESEDK